MKLAEALLQDKPIRREGMLEWYFPRVKNRGAYALILECTNKKMSGYALHGFSFDADDWEVKQEPMKFEFECVWRKNAAGTLYPEAIVREIGMFDKMVDSGKSFKVTCEEVEG